jgi:hypothetical protein
MEGLSHAGELKPESSDDERRDADSDRSVEPALEVSLGKMLFTSSPPRMARIERSVSLN